MINKCLGMLHIVGAHYGRQKQLVVINLLLLVADTSSILQGALYVTRHGFSLYSNPPQQAPVSTLPTNNNYLESFWENFTWQTPFTTLPFCHVFHNYKTNSR